MRHALMQQFNPQLEPSRAGSYSRALSRCTLAALLALACSQPSDARPAATQPGNSTLSQPNTTQGSPNVPANAQPPASIGTASMKEDGTIVLMLRATGPGGMLGDSLVEYPKGHPNYDDVLKHLGGLKPGEQKPVPPFP